MPRSAQMLLALALGACLLVGALEAHAEHFGALTVVLAVSAAAAGAAVVPSAGAASISASFIVAMLAAAFLGPVTAAACVLLAEVSIAWRKHTEPEAAAFNVLGSVGPALVAGTLLRALVPSHHNEAAFYVLVAAAGALYLTLNFGVAALGLRALHWEQTLTLKLFWQYTPTQALNIALAVAGAAIYVKVGLPGIVFALIALITFSYMASLVEEARDRAERYVSLSWGVLAGLLRSLDVRDGRAARHAAAVARFARDMAAAVDMNDRDQELAHTAGLLHDIGHFALSDRVHERGRVLTDDDWEAIHRHPKLGAEMLKDLGMYGPVAEIVLAHHERIDGIGYPDGLPGDEIPEIANIIAVAEVYDTLTAQDTYRTRMSSFEALNELRRVSGSQLDERYVEVLAGLLRGENLEYRHADEADFDSELDMERRIREAGEPRIAESDLSRARGVVARVGARIRSRRGMNRFAPIRRPRRT